MTRMTICVGDWCYTKTVWHGTFTAANDATGETHDTGCRELADARAFVAQLAPAQAPAGVTYSLAAGPQRARAGHQRLPRANHFE